MDAAITLMFIGLSSSGKTALIRSATNNQSQIYPTAGIQITYITSASRTLLVYDLSGEGSSRSNWNMIGTTADCVVYVIDSHNTGTIHLAKKHLYLFLQQNKYMKKKNLCIMLNKCDKKERPAKEILVRALGAQKLGKLVNKLYIKQTSAFNRQGMDECFQWVIKNYSNEESKQ